MPSITNTTREIIAEEKDKGNRLDLFLTSKMSDLSRSRIQELIKEGHVTLNGKSMRCRDEVHTGDFFLIQEQPQKPMARAFAEEIPLAVLYEDADLLIVDKPAGMVVHVGPDHEQGTLVNALLHREEQLSTGSEPHRPGIVHRLDKETSGCIIIAKNNATHTELSQLFADRKIQKTYLAVVVGVPRQRKGTISLPIGRHPIQRCKMTTRRLPEGREAITDYEVLAKTTTHSLVACSPHTGRMHQIRVHLQHLGHAIVGDPLYGKRENWNRHLLHAWKIQFNHPRDGRLILCEAPLPKDFLSVIPWKPPILITNKK